MSCVKVEVDALVSPCDFSELRSCVKVEADARASTCDFSELRSCMKVEMNALVSRSLIVLSVSVDVKQH